MAQPQNIPMPQMGDIKGTMYLFHSKGDVLPKHVHNEDNNHITIVTSGSLKAYSHDWSVEAKAGQTLDFNAGEPHEFMALEDNTKIINIIKKHDGYVDDFEKERTNG